MMLNVMKYDVAEKLDRFHEELCQNWNCVVDLVDMDPDHFLSHVHCPNWRSTPSCDFRGNECPDWCFLEANVDSISCGIERNALFPALYLNLVEDVDAKGLAQDHEGRHRSFVAKKCGMTVPVVVVHYPGDGEGCESKRDRCLIHDAGNIIRRRGRFLNRRNVHDSRGLEEWVRSA